MIPPRFEFADMKGLIGGFAFHPPQPPRPIGWNEIADLSSLRGAGGFVWLHFNLTDVRTCEWIAHGGVVPAEAAHFLLAIDNRIRLDPLGQGIAGVLGDLHFDF